MAKLEKVLRKVLSGRSDANIAFSDLCNLLTSVGFEERIKGSHHIFRMAGIIDKPNLQKEGNMAKPYQVGQVRNVILKYKLGGEIHE